MKLSLWLATIFPLLRLVDSQCGCGCCCCCDCVYTIVTTPDPLATTDNTSSNPPMPPINRAKTPNKLSMEDYIKIQSVIKGKSRARRYNYDLSAQLAADSPHYRHDTRDELLSDDEDLELHISTTSARPHISLIGAINPQKLPGGPYIPAPIRNFDKEEHDDTSASEQLHELHLTS